MDGINIVKEFKGEFMFLSNFYISRFRVPNDPHLYYSGEHYFQSKKALKPEEKLKIIQALNPGEAKRFGRKCTIIPNWDDVKVSVMKKCIHWKFINNPTLLRKLLELDGYILEEGNTWGDRYWGKDIKTGIGENMLGKILMGTIRRIKYKEDFTF